MWKRAIIAGAMLASLLTAFVGKESFAVSGDTATVSGGDSQEICVITGTNYIGSQFVADITADGFESQVVFESFTGRRCKTVKLDAGEYSVKLNSPMGVSGISYENEGNSLQYTIAEISDKYLSTYGTIHKAVAASEEVPANFPKVFAISGACTFNGSGTVTGDTCVDSNNHSYVGADNVDTGIALFSEENAGKDFEVYFEITDYSTSQPNQQATIFNAKLESSSRYYPGFTFRVLDNTSTSQMELTSRLGTKNSSEKKTQKFTSSLIKGKGIKIVRINGIIKYSIDGAPFTVFDDFSSFSNYFDQVAVFGSSLTSSDVIQRKFSGTISNMYIKLGTYEEESDASLNNNVNTLNTSMAAGTRTTRSFAPLLTNDYYFAESSEDTGEDEDDEEAVVSGDNQVENVSAGNESGNGDGDDDDDVVIVPETFDIGKDF